MVNFSSRTLYESTFGRRVNRVTTTDNWKIFKLITEMCKHALHSRIAYKNYCNARVSDLGIKLKEIIPWL
jgi:hypothetical protein